MRLGAGEVLQRRAPGVQRHHPQVGLQAGRGADGGLGRAADDHCSHVRPGGEGRHQRGRVLRRGQDVHVPDRLPPAPQRAGVGAALAARDLGQRGHHGRRRAHGHVEQDPLAALAVHLDSARQPLLAARPEPGQPFQPARLDRRGELVHRRDAQVVVKLQGALRPEAGDPGQLQHPGRDPGPQLVQRGDPPGRGVLGDLGRDRGAHPGDGPQALGVELAYILAPAADGPGRLLVVPGPEHVAAGDLDQLGILAQQPRDFLVEPGHRLTLGERVRRGAPRQCGGHPAGPVRENFQAAGRRCWPRWPAGSRPGSSS